MLLEGYDITSGWVVVGPKLPMWRPVSCVCRATFFCDASCFPSGIRRMLYKRFEQLQGSIENE